MEWRLVDPPNEKSAAPGITNEGKLADSLGKAFSRERTTTWRLDPARGLFPVQIVFTHVPADGSAPDVRRLDLERAEQMPAEETAALAAQARDFCALHDAYLRALDGAVEPSADAESQLAEAWTDLALARNRIRSEVRGPLDSLLLRHHGRVKELREHARLVAELRARTPADWTADDTSGKTHRAADYRGQIVVLDFWFAACGPCLRAVPTIKRLRQAFPADQVAILGANVDDDPGEARWVVERAGIEYPTLLARALADEYGVSSYPTFVILGRDGRVREKFVAEGRALHEKLDSTLRRLLAGPPEGASDRTLPSSP
jgi:thiol-disulfide isomerase/thioredoxin